MNPVLAGLLRRHDVWRVGKHHTDENSHNVTTGFAVLDDALPGGGWPQAALTEILIARYGGGEVRLVLPAIASMTQEQGWTAWVSPPYLPYAPALVEARLKLSQLVVIRPQRDKDSLWSAEQALRSGACTSVLVWLDAASERDLRRLQLAAEQGGTTGFLFRPLRRATQRSPVALRLVLEPQHRGTQVEVLKCRGKPFSVMLDPV